MLGSWLASAGDIMERGGWAMWPLLAMSLVSIALSVERFVFWGLTHRLSRAGWVARVADALRAGDRGAVESLCARDDSVYGGVARGLLARRAGEAAAVELIEAHRPTIERFGVALSTIITAAPLLGILGTVTGIIQSFDLLGRSGADAVSDPTLVAGGIAEALLTTAFGLVVATLTLFPFAFFRASAGKCLGRLEGLVAAAEQAPERGG
ncbi:MAG: MotA/TolQ/ExbB proton channel family protein [Phycisphaerales bacterium]